MPTVTVAALAGGTRATPRREVQKGAAVREVLSTESVRESDRIEYWHDVVCSVFWPLSVRMARESHYRASVTRDVCGTLELSTVTAEGQFVRRTAAQAGAGPADRVVLGLQLAGRGVVIQDGRECRLDRGEATLFDPARPYSMAFAEHFSLTLFGLPRSLVRSVPVDSRQLTARPLRPSTAVSSGALSYLSCLGSISTTSGLDDAALANGAAGIAMTLVRDALGTPATRPGEDGAEDCYRRATAFIDLHLQDPALTPALVAAACHVSLRQLYRVFDTRGEAVAESIRRRRLERARSLLETLPADTPVGWIGPRCGFSSPEQFSRAFREAHGLPPATWRATTGAAAVLETNSVAQ